MVGLLGSCTKGDERKAGRWHQKTGTEGDEDDIDNHDHIFRSLLTRHVAVVVSSGEW